MTPSNDQPADADSLPAATSELPDPFPDPSLPPIVDLDASQTPSATQDPAVLALRDDEIDDLQAQVRRLEDALLALEFRYLDPQDPATWPPVNDDSIVCWLSNTRKAVVTTGQVGTHYRFFADGVYYAWMPLTTPPKG